MTFNFSWMSHVLLKAIQRLISVKSRILQVLLKDIQRLIFVKDRMPHVLLKDIQNLNVESLAQRHSKMHTWLRSSVLLKDNQNFICEFRAVFIHFMKWFSITCNRFVHWNDMTLMPRQKIIHLTNLKSKTLVAVSKPLAEFEPKLLQSPLIGKILQQSFNSKWMIFLSGSGVVMLQFGVCSKL